ncbi:MAG: imidazole glycerol phosphate synthase, glutamine amidotransferase subunit [Rhizobiales bacterium NRL2]|jgi:glutamine amidotransferase|nr:MAG: imidazole glycerol phosphate synthase, glutamine amidotransferase subunit [Rhizobiales bacterium NRL2]
MITIIDYGAGNLGSVVSAFEHLGAPVKVATAPEELRWATKLVLPGVGAYGHAMANIRGRGFEAAIREKVDDEGVPLLGICVGMQVLSDAGEEGRESRGLGYVGGEVRRFRFDEDWEKRLKIPHVGFNTVRFPRESRLMRGLGEAADFYFTHSYRMTGVDPDAVAGVCSHGESFTVAVERGHVCGTQFHVEKSQTNGLKVLRNFIEFF